MTSITSVSGGKTSSYMAIHYPTDKYVFALVKTLDKASISTDNGLIKEVQKKVPDFIASRELDETLISVLNLEQRLGTEIKWVSANETFDELIARKKMLPNQRTRFCTSELKLKPIFEYCYLNFGLSVMNIGFRHDEKQRMIKMLSDCNKAYNYKYKGKNIEWRIPNFPLIENNIDHDKIKRFWAENGGVEFPTISNCDFCFFHRVSEQIKQQETYPERAKWWQEQEKSIGHTFAKNYSFLDITQPDKQIKELPLFAGCSCTD